MTWPKIGISLQTLVKNSHMESQMITKLLQDLGVDTVSQTDQSKRHMEP